MYYSPERLLQQRRNVTILTPTRGRPQRAADLIETLEQTCYQDPDAERRSALVLGVCTDDPELDTYLSLPSLYAFARTPWTLFSFDPPAGGHRGFVYPLNLMAGLDWHTSAFAVLGDDHRPRTLNWDLELFSEMRPTPSFSYGNDLVHGQGLPTAVMMAASVQRALGYIAPPQLGHLYVDNTWKAWGQALDKLTYMPSVIIEHEHPLVGKAPSDATYEAQRPDLDEPLWVQYATGDTDVRPVWDGVTGQPLSRLEVDIQTMRDWKWFR